MPEVELSPTAYLSLVVYNRVCTPQKELGVKEEKKVFVWDLPGEPISFKSYDNEFKSEVEYSDDKFEC